MSKRFRHYLALLITILIYYIIHEGAHLLIALHYGVFKQINFMGLGVQVDVYAERMTEVQLGVLCLAGAVATLVFGWLLLLLCRKICAIKSKMFKTIMWYTSLAFLLLDPLYLSVLYSFFGGGDMNGIRLLFPENAVRIVFVAVGVIHGIVIWKYLLPEYTKAFQTDGIKEKKSD